MHCMMILVIIFGTQKTLTTLLKWNCFIKPPLDDPNWFTWVLSKKEKKHSINFVLIRKTVHILYLHPSRLKFSIFLFSCVCAWMHVCVCVEREIPCIVILYRGISTLQCLFWGEGIPALWLMEREIPCIVAVAKGIPCIATKSN